MGKVQSEPPTRIVSDTSSRLSDKDEHAFPLAECQAAWLVKDEVPPTRLAVSCRDQATFIVPLFGRDKLIRPAVGSTKANSVQLNRQEVFSLCAKHHAQYTVHANSNKCLVIGCNVAGDDYVSKDGVTVRECPAHAKIRILTDAMERSKSASEVHMRLPARVKKTSSIPEPGSPPYAPFGPIPSFRYPE